MGSVFPISVYSNEDDLTLTLDLEIIIGNNMSRKLFSNTGRERLIRSHSLARFCFELSGNSN